MDLELEGPSRPEQLVYDADNNRCRVKNIFVPLGEAADTSKVSNGTRPLHLHTGREISHTLKRRQLHDFK